MGLLKSLVEYVWNDRVYVKVSYCLVRESCSKSPS